MSHLIIAIGSNLGDKYRNIQDAIMHIKTHFGIQDVCISNIYITNPLTLPDQDNIENYCNAVIKIQTNLPATKVMAQLQQIELLMGRAINHLRWSPRIIDLDIIAYGNLVMSSDNLTIPHPEMHLRDFVLQPMLDIYPEWRYPVQGSPFFGYSVKDLLVQLDVSYIVSEYRV